MERLSWNAIDKSTWPEGPWKSEPDKLQWQDDATGLPCLIKRVGHSGHLCGYVGIPVTHPFHGRGYDKLTVSVHGGLTFADGCQDLYELWDEYRIYAERAKIEARKFPSGDAAQFLQAWEALLDDRAAFNEHAIATTICHIPAPGESDDVWWFGFDCAHAQDMLPRMQTQSGLIRHSVYRDLSYVKKECESLAVQLKELSL